MKRLWNDNRVAINLDNRSENVRNTVRSFCDQRRNRQRMSRMWISFVISLIIIMQLQRQLLQPLKQKMQVGLSQSQQSLSKDDIIPSTQAIGTSSALNSNLLAMFDKPAEIVTAATLGTVASLQSLELSSNQEQQSEQRLETFSPTWAVTPSPSASLFRRKFMKELENITSDTSEEDSLTLEHKLVSVHPPTKATDMKTGAHSCINSDFVPTHDRAAFTLLIPNGDEHIKAAIVLGTSLRQWHNSTQSNSTAHDRVVLELSTQQLSRHQWARLQRSGAWTHKCTIQPVQATQRPSPRFKDQFAKLRVWGMTVYSVAIYMDADTLVLGNMDELWNLNLDNYSIGVTRDFRYDYSSKHHSGDWVDSFNMGVFVIQPNTTEYNRLLQMQRDGAIREYEHIMAEQGWLNAVYKDQWLDIGLRYNANIAARHIASFQEQHDDLRIVHYTVMKPWACRPQSPDYTRFCKPWIEQRETSKRFGCINDDFVPPKDETRIAIVTFVTDTVEKHPSQEERKKPLADYTYGAAALIKSIQEHVGATNHTSSNPTARQFDTILLEIPTRRLPDADRTWLKDLGWNFCTVTPIEAKHKPFGRFVDQFNKLHVWSFVEFDTVVYLDSDNLVTGNVDGLLSRRLSNGKMIGVTRDFFGSRFVDTFNMGVFIIHPNLTEFGRLIELQANDLIAYDKAQAEQGFLNQIYRQQWEEIGLEYNANMAVWAAKQDAWPENPKITHYTLEKPWQESVPKHRAQSKEPLDVFLNTWKVKAREYSVWTFDW